MVTGQKRRASVPTFLGMGWILTCLSGLWHQPLWRQQPLRLFFFSVSAHPDNSLQHHSHVHLCEANRAEVVLLPVVGPFPIWFVTVLLSEATLALWALRPVVDSHGSYAAEGLVRTGSLSPGAGLEKNERLLFFLFMLHIMEWLPSLLATVYGVLCNKHFRSIKSFINLTLHFISITICSWENRNLRSAQMIYLRPWCQLVAELKHEPRSVYLPKALQGSASWVPALTSASVSGNS